MFLRPALALALLLVAADASATEASQCVAAVDQAQLARYHGKLSEARTGFLQCARTECPEAIRTDCAHWLAEVEASLPSVVLGAQWSDGSDVVGATITVDGTAVPDAGRGRALTLDPGEHTIGVAHKDAPAKTVTVVVHEGEKNRPVKVTLARAAASPMPVAMTRPVPLASYLLAGAAVVGAGVSIGLWVSGRSGLDDLRSSCGHLCQQDDVDGQRHKLLAGDLVMAASVVALGAATWIFLHRPARERLTAFTF